MNIENMSNEELQHVINSANLKIDIYKDKMETYSVSIKELKNEQNEAQTVLDKREISKIEQMTFEDKLYHLFDNIYNKNYSNKSSYYSKYNYDFFDSLGIRLYHSSEMVRLMLHKDFVTLNEEKIKKYIPFLFKFTKLHEQDNGRIDIQVYDNFFIEYISYFPKENHYIVEGNSGITYCKTVEHVVTKLRGL